MTWKDGNMVLMGTGQTERSMDSVGLSSVGSISVNHRLPRIGVLIRPDFNKVFKFVSAKTTRLKSFMTSSNQLSSPYPLIESK